VPDVAKPAAPTAPTISDAHQAPVSEKQDIDLFSGEDPVSPDRAQIGVDSAPLVDGAVEDLGADSDSVEDPIREEMLRRRRRLTLAPRPISALARSRLVASADEAPVHSSDNQPEVEEAPVTSAEYGEFFHSAILAGFNSDEAAGYALEKCSGEFNVKKNKFYALSEETLCEDFWNQIGFPKGSRWWESDSIGQLPCQSTFAGSRSSNEADIADREKTRSIANQPARSKISTGFALR
jgi:hypothetical protein